MSSIGNKIVFSNPSPAAKPVSIAVQWIPVFSLLPQRIAGIIYYLLDSRYCRTS